MLWNLKFG